jgi:hypothetical protein
VVTQLLDAAAARVDLSACGCERVPPEVAGLPRGALRELVLTNNRLLDLPQARAGRRALSRAQGPAGSGPRLLGGT